MEINKQLVMLNEHLDEKMPLKKKWGKNKYSEVSISYPSFLVAGVHFTINWILTVVDRIK